jgi:hypothetical protein
MEGMEGEVLPSSVPRVFDLSSLLPFFPSPHPSFPSFPSSLRQKLARLMIFRFRFQIKNQIPHFIITKDWPGD